MDDKSFIEEMQERIPDLYLFLWKAREEGFTDEESFELTKVLFEKLLDIWG